MSRAGSYDKMSGGMEADVFVFDEEFGNGARDLDVITDFEAGVDEILLSSSDYGVAFTSRYALISVGTENDRIIVYGDAQTEGDLGITVGTFDLA